MAGRGTVLFCAWLAWSRFAIDTGRTVGWFSIEELGALVRRHRADDSFNKAIRRITRVDLTMVDDIALLTVGEDAAEGFYRLVEPATRSARWPAAATCTPPASMR
jgi:hypothetical protein